MRRRPVRSAPRRPASRAGRDDRSARRASRCSTSRGDRGPDDRDAARRPRRRVMKIEPPGGDPTRAFSGTQVWHRGKRSADARPPRRRRPRPSSSRSATRADVLRRELRPRHDHEPRHRLRHAARAQPAASSTARSPPTATTGVHADRPGYDALVAARTGHQWESRGVPGGTIGPPRRARPAFARPRRARRLLGRGAAARVRSSPACRGSSLAACYLATLGISAALRVREHTGRGQRVETSLLQGVLATTSRRWQRVEHVETENFHTWISDPRAPKGLFQCADGRWIHQWVPLPDFVLSAADGDRVRRTATTTRARDAPDAHRHRRRRDAAAAPLPAADGRRASPSSRRNVDRARRRGRACRSSRCARPRRRCTTPRSLADGCVIEVDDPELGPVRQVGSRLRARTRARPATRRAARRRGRHRRGARRGRRGAARPPPGRHPVRRPRRRAAPLDGRPRARPRARGRRARAARSCSPTSAPTSSRSTRCTTSTG